MVAESGALELFSRILWPRFVETLTFLTVRCELTWLTMVTHTDKESPGV